MYALKMVVDNQREMVVAVLVDGNKEPPLRRAPRSRAFQVELNAVDWAKEAFLTPGISGIKAGDQGGDAKRTRAGARLLGLRPELWKNREGKVTTGVEANVILGTTQGVDLVATATGGQGKEEGRLVRKQRERDHVQRLEGGRPEGTQDQGQIPPWETSG